MHEHDGDILVESQPQAGSRFILRMPAVLPEPETGEIGRQSGVTR
jgi:signal transduction histidine kinase